MGGHCRFDNETKRRLMKIATPRLVAALALCASPLGRAQSEAPLAQPQAVTVDNFTRAESDWYFANLTRLAGGLGKFFHRRELVPVDRQLTVRPNRDTLYS